MSKVAVIVGVGPGLGASLAHRFAREGFAVGLVARSKDKLLPVEEALKGTRTVCAPADAGDPKSIAAAFAKIRESLGAPDVLVYNAGAFQMGGILDITPEHFDACFRANCSGALFSAQQVLPDMIARKSGTILLTGATASLRGSARFAALATGKFALRALAQSMAREFSPQGIHVAHVVIDGQINTPRGPKRDAATMLSPDAIAETYWQLHTQHPTAWTLEIDLRPSVEKF